MSMRWLLAAAWALLILSGCGRNAADPPTASLKGGKDGVNPEANKKNNPERKNDTAAPEVKKAVASAPKKEGVPVVLGAGFDPDDARRTLHWLTASLAKVRALPPDDAAALDREWESYTRALKAADKQKIRWVLPVESVTAEGVLLETLTSPDDPACNGMRLKPHKQPVGYTSFILEAPAARRSALRPGERVTVTGVVEAIETEPGRRHYNARHYGFNVRLSGIALAPGK
jgi:hypothetical protein